MESKNSLKTLENTLELLDLLSTHRQEIGISDLSRKLGISKPAVHRIVTTLHERGLLQKNPGTGRYALGLKLWEIGCRAVDRMGIRELAFPFLEELWRLTGETVYLATYDRGEVVWIEKIDSQKSIRVNTRLGGRAPAHCVACGKAMLAFLPETAITELLGNLASFTETTIVDGAALQAELQVVRQRGYAVSNREWDPAVVGVAAPVWNSGHRAVASIGVSAPGASVSPTWLDEVGPLAVTRAEGLSAALGFLPAL